MTKEAKKRRQKKRKQAKKQVHAETTPSPPNPPPSYTYRAINHLGVNWYNYLARSLQEFNTSLPEAFGSIGPIDGYRSECFEMTQEPGLIKFCEEEPENMVRDEQGRSAVGQTNARYSAGGRLVSAVIHIVKGLTPNYILPCHELYHAVTSQSTHTGWEEDPCHFDPSKVKV